MLIKKVKSRIKFLIISMLLLTIVIFLILKSLEENIVYFFSPTEIYDKSNISLNEKIRIGGLVKEESIKKDQTSINFIITDVADSILAKHDENYMPPEVSKALEKSKY